MGILALVLFPGLTSAAALTIVLVAELDELSFWPLTAACAAIPGLLSYAVARSQGQDARRWGWTGAAAGLCWYVLAIFVVFLTVIDDLG